MVYLNSKMKFIFIIYQTVIHSCRSHYGYHHQYSDYDSEDHPEHNIARGGGRNLETKFLTRHRAQDGLRDTGSIYPPQNGGVDENVVVVPYPVPVLIFPINKQKQQLAQKEILNKQLRHNKLIVTNDNITSTTAKAFNQSSNQDSGSDKTSSPKKSSEDTDKSNSKPNDSSQETEQTTLESDIHTQKISGITLDTEIENNDIFTKIVEKIDEETQTSTIRNVPSTEITPTITTTQKAENTKIPINVPDPFEAAPERNDIVQIMDKRTLPFPTQLFMPKQQNENIQTIRPSYLRIISTVYTTPTYKPLNLNGRYMLHRDKGPMNLGVRYSNRPRVRGHIRLRPTIAQKTTTRDIKSLPIRELNMPDFGLVPINIDLAKQLNQQLRPMLKNFI